ncbi:MAG: SpoIIIAH-like family protein [Clostridia bacterium]|nr:SpoIIIAH-like family protein [Clostridia bacterium]
MSIKLKKGKIAVVAMVLALGSAVFINWYYTSPQKAPEQEAATSVSSQERQNLGDAQYVSATTAKDAVETFAQFSVERENAHAKAQESLEKIIKDPSSDKEAVKDATKSLEDLSQSIKRENDLETLINAKTGGKCIVIISDNTIKVVTQPGSLSDTVTMQIKELIMNQGGFQPENINIFEMNSGG